MILAHYKCCCFAEEVSVSIPPRRADEKVEEWMSLCVQPALYLDHRVRSPLCKESTVEYLKIPMPENAEFIGAQPKVN